MLLHPLKIVLRIIINLIIWAKPYSKVTVLVCRLPLTTFFYSTRDFSSWRPDAVHWYDEAWKSLIPLIFHGSLEAHSIMKKSFHNLLWISQCLNTTFSIGYRNNSSLFPCFHINKKRQLLWGLPVTSSISFMSPLLLSN